jgi:hypothetical protein
VGRQVELNVIKLTGARPMVVHDQLRWRELALLRAWLVGHVIAVEAWSFASWIQASRANRLNGAGKDVDQGAHEVEELRPGFADDGLAVELEVKLLPQGVMP